MHLIYLPYSDDIRHVDELHTDPNSVPHATDDQIKKASALVRRINLKDFSVCQFANPALQRHYAVLQALALDEDEMPEIKDKTLPDEEGMARPGIVKALEEFKLSVYGENYEEDDSNIEGKVEPTTKRKANAMRDQYANYDWADLADNVKGRAREAGEINKSLLTLGRVPYRDSKLTRLLRDSLAGKTKSCITATISPSAHYLEETLSTLDYAHRAKNIKNKPEANQRMSKAVLLKHLYLELERMKQDVRAAREKNGVYVPHERFLQDEAEKKAKDEKIELLEIDLNISEKQIDKFRELYLSEQEKKLNLKAEFKDCQANLENSKKVLHELQENYRIAISTLKEKELIISKQIHSGIDHKGKLEADNQNLLRTFGSRLDDSLGDLHKVIHELISQQQQQLRGMEEHVSSFLASKCDVTKVMESKINKMTQTYTSSMASLKELVDALQLEASSDVDQIKSKISSHATTVEKFLIAASLEAKDFISDIKNSLDGQRQVLDFSAKQQEELIQRQLKYLQLLPFIHLAM